MGHCTRFRVRALGQLVPSVVTAEILAFSSGVAVAEAPLVDHGQRDDWDSAVSDAEAEATHEEAELFVIAELEMASEAQALLVVAVSGVSGAAAPEVVASEAAEFHGQVVQHVWVSLAALESAELAVEHAGDAGESGADEHKTLAGCFEAEVAFAAVEAASEES